MNTNRQARRIAKAQSRNQAVDRALAVHEAGHAVARIMGAASLGWDAEEAVEYIDIHAAPAAGRGSFDGKAVLRSQAVTFGKFLSRPMQDHFNGLPKDSWSDKGSWPAIFVEMRSAGIDLDWWFRTKSLECIFGPMAEAKLLSLPFDDVWLNYSAENDVAGLIHAGKLCGLSDDQIEESIDPNVALAEHYISQPEPWRAVLALADRMKYGRTPGRLVASIVAPHLRVQDTV